MLRLRTFGGLTLEGVSQQGDWEPRPRVLALLAVLAAGGSVRRDRILAVLWPDSDADRARHALSQMLYVMRRDFGHDVVKAGTELKLDASAITSDVAAFTAALADGKRAEAVALHGGPFLDGFYLSDAPEFERWVEDERERLRRATESALSVLAESASAAVRFDESATWWERLTRLDPLSARYAMGYMLALAAGGDRARALSHGRAYEALLRRELDAEPEPAIRELTDSLRRGIAAAPNPLVQAAPASIAAAPRADTPNDARVTTPRPRVRSWGVVAVLLGAAAGVVMLSQRRNAGAPSAPITAVGFISEPASDSLQLGTVVRGLLATSLGRVEGLQVIAHSRLLELMRTGSDANAQNYLDAARRAGASEVIEGTLERNTEGALVLDLQRVLLPRGVVRGGYRVEAKDHMALVDSATAWVARSAKLVTPLGTVRDVTTSSPIAFRFYEQGLRQFYHLDPSMSIALLRAAVAEDSVFPMAALYLWRATSYAQAASASEDLERALRLAPRATERERLLILGQAFSIHSDQRGAAAAESLAARYPDDPEAHALLGYVRNLQGDYAGAVHAYERAIVIDSALSTAATGWCRLCISLVGLTDVYQWWDSLPAAERTARRLIRFRPAVDMSWELLSGVLRAAGRVDETLRAQLRADSLRPVSRDASRAMPLMHLLADDFESADLGLREALRSPSRTSRADARWLYVISLRNQGRLREAAVLADRGQVPGPDGFVLGLPRDSVSVAIVALESGRPGIFSRFFLAQDSLASDSAPRGFRARNRSWRYALGATGLAMLGDTSRVRELAGRIESIAQESLYGRDRKLPYLLRGLIAARAGRHEEAVTLYRESIHSWTFGYTRANYELARSALALGRPAEAIAALQPALRGGWDGSNLYITRTELHETLGEAFARAGQVDSAVAHFRVVARAWRRADPRFIPRRDSARAFLMRHSPRPPGSEPALSLGPATG